MLGTLGQLQVLVARGHEVGITLADENRVERAGTDDADDDGSGEVGDESGVDLAGH